MGEGWNPTGCTRRASRGGLEAEDPDDPSLARVSRELGCEVSGRPDVCRIVGAYIAREQEPIAADAGIYGDVLLAVRSAERNRRAHDARTDFELPQLAAALCIRRLEPSVQRPIDDDISRAANAAAPDREFLFDLPDSAAACGVSRDKRSHVSARPGEVRRCCPDIRSSPKPPHAR